MRSLDLPGGGALPALGLGTWRMGESPGRRAAEVAALRAAIAMGYRLIDTAEMYGEGLTETLVGQALAEAFKAGDVTRDELFIVSKVYPHNASRAGTPAACARSLARLGLDRIDLYLLHWRGTHPLAETVAALQALVQAGRIGHWGVSNFDTDDMAELAAVERELGAESASRMCCATNQVYFALSERGPEFSLLPALRARGLPMMAYSPIAQGALAREPVLAEIAARHGVSAGQVALAWVLSRDGVVAIPKAVREPHLRENLAAASLVLSADVAAELERRFPAPRGKTPLAMI